MDRQAEIMEMGKLLLEKRYQDDLAVIQSKMQAEDVVEELLRAFDQIFIMAGKQQEAGEKEPVAFCNISYLRSSILTKSYDFLIALYDETMYFDPIETLGSWAPKWIMEFYENQVSYFRKEVRGKIVRVQDSELLEFERTLAGDYYKIVLGFLLEHLEEIQALESYQKLEKTADFKIQYGEYMDVCIPIYQEEEEKLV